MKKIIISLGIICTICVVCILLLDVVHEKEAFNDLNGVSMTIKDGTLTRTECTIVITDFSGKDYIYGEWYRIEKKEGGKWVEVEKILDEDIFFNTIGYRIDKNKQLEISHNWEWLYGKLSKGKYRIVKEVDSKYMSVEFNL